MSAFDKLMTGQKMYYPSTSGIALICEVIKKSEDDVLVDIEGSRYFIPKSSVDKHAITLDEEKSITFVSQRIEDPENKIIYLRYKYNDGFIDRFYNWYCDKFKKDPNHKTIFDDNYRADGHPAIETITE